MLHRRDSLNPLAAAVIGICGTLLAATYTAQASQVAAQGGWPPPVEMSQHRDETSRGPELALDENGDLHVIWMEPEGVTFTVHHGTSSDQGSNWIYSGPLPAADSRFNAAMDVTDVDVHWIVHTFWLEGLTLDELWYAPLSGDGWGYTELISQTRAQMATPDVVVATDFVHAVWSKKVSGAQGSQFDVFYSRSEAGGAWSPVTTTLETHFSAFGPRVTADQAGNLHLVWQEYAVQPQIYYISGTVYTTETVWSTLPIALSEDLNRRATTPDIVVGSDNTVHVVFGVDVESQEKVQDIYYAGFPITDSGVVSATLIPNSTVTVSHQLPTYVNPAIALFGDDQVHVAWNGWKAGDNWDSDRIYYAVSEDGGLSWSEPVAISPRDSRPDGFPSLAVDAEFVHAVWQEKVPPTDQDIYYTRRFPVRIPLPLGLKEF